MYVLNIDQETGRILSAGIMPNPPADAVQVETLPDGDITDYLYVDGEYAYDPLPEPEEETKPSNDERITALENQLAAYEAAYTEGVNEA